jgi:hypothetical protein
MQQRGDGWHRLLLIGQEQRLRPAHGAGGGIALLDKGIEQPASVVTPLHDICLGHGSLLSEVSVPKNTDKRNRCNRLLVLAWIVYGALMLVLPYVPAPQWLTMPAPFLDGEWAGWLGLVPPLLAGIIGAVMSCVWFGWYLAVCFLFNGHNNEVGGAARIEEFKQFIRFCLTKHGLTGYVIGLDHPQTGNNRHLLSPKIIDVFHLRVKAGSGEGGAAINVPPPA